MSFAVTWNPRATLAIDEAWDGATAEERRQIYTAIEVLSQSLRDDPLRTGESRASGLQRMAFEPPITVFFRVEGRLGSVRVFAACVSRRKG